MKNIPCRRRQTRARARQGSGAFTLVEVLIVVAIIGIAGAIVVPQMLQVGALSPFAHGRACHNSAKNVSGSSSPASPPCACPSGSR